MKLLSTVFSLALASNVALGSSWFSKAGEYQVAKKLSIAY